jgi:hypothetical protein
LSGFAAVGRPRLQHSSCLLAGCQLQRQSTGTGRQLVKQQLLLLLLLLLLLNP